MGLRMNRKAAGCGVRNEDSTPGGGDLLASTAMPCASETPTRIVPPSARDIQEVAIGEILEEPVMRRQELIHVVLEPRVQAFDQQISRLVPRKVQPFEDFNL